MNTLLVLVLYPYCRLSLNAIQAFCQNPAGASSTKRMEFPDRGRIALIQIHMKTPLLERSNCPELTEEQVDSLRLGKKPMTRDIDPDRVQGLW